MVRSFEPPPDPLVDWRDYMEFQNQEKLGGYLSQHPAQGLFLDIGCNVGDWTFAALAAGFRKVVAVDFDSTALRGLRTRAQKHGAQPNIQIVECRVVPGYNRRNNDEIGFNFLIDVVAANGKIQLMKMDVKGDEYSILTDSPDEAWMDDVAYLNLETHEHGDWVKPASGICDHSAMMEWLIRKGWGYQQNGNFKNERGEE